MGHLRTRVLVFGYKKHRKKPKKTAVLAGNGVGVERWPGVLYDVQGKNDCFFCHGSDVGIKGGALIKEEPSRREEKGRIINTW